MKATIVKRRLGESSSCNSEERRVKVKVESKRRGGGGGERVLIVVKLLSRHTNDEQLEKSANCLCFEYTPSTTP